MTGNAINAEREALELHELSSEQLDAVSGGSFVSILGAFVAAIQSLQQQQGGEGPGGGQVDPAQQFQQILQQSTRR